MREIKFRAFDKKLNSMHQLAGFIQFNEFTEIHYGAAGFKRCENDGIVLMQYTGLKDKNGKEIYEGDIIKTQISVGDVQFSHGVFGIEWTHNKRTKGMIGTWGQLHNLKTMDDWHMNGGAQMEVIGNIYENPELELVKIVLEQKDLQIRALKAGFKDVNQESKPLRSQEQREPDGGYYDVAPCEECGLGLQENYLIHNEQKKLWLCPDCSKKSLGTTEKWIMAGRNGMCVQKCASFPNCRPCGDNAFATSLKLLSNITDDHAISLVQRWMKSPAYPKKDYKIIRHEQKLEVILDNDHFNEKFYISFITGALWCPTQPLQYKVSYHLYNFLTELGYELPINSQSR